MKSFFTLILSFFAFSFSWAQPSYWTDISEERIMLPAESEIALNAKVYRTLTLDYEPFIQQIAHAPIAFTAAAQTAPVAVTLPLPDGTLESFEVVESKIMAAELSQKYPQIKAYTAISKKRPLVTARFEVTAKGLTVGINTPDGRVHVEPYATQPSRYYISYFKRDLQLPDMPAFICGYEDHEGKVDQAQQQRTRESEELSFRGTSGANVPLRTYRLALACTGEFAQGQGGTMDGVMSAYAIAINRVNEIFQSEVSVVMELIPGNDELINLDATSDPFFSANNGASLLQQNQDYLTNTIGLGAFDVGHIFTGGCINNIGGIAGGTVCTPLNKGRGVTCFSSNNVVFIAEKIMAHEIGHQFDVGHSWNNCPPTLDQLSFPNAFEPGSGSTIMSYGGSCGNQDIVAYEDTGIYYNVGSLEDFIFYAREGNGATCGTETITGNHEPEIQMGYEDGFFIPISTPFKLSAEATDEDGDALTYVWEQFDIGPVSPIGQPEGNAPLFRSFEPTPTGNTRTFPRLNKIINNSFDNFEVLPTYDRDLTFQLVVRDNNAIQGATVWQPVAFKSDGTSGPFQVEFPNSDTVVWTVGDYQEVRWDVANTDNNRVRCYHVDIKLSVDGGFTYPFTLLEGTPNDGSAFITVPDAVSDDARIRVEAADNIFFDISNDDFEILPATEPGFAMSLTPESVSPVCLPEVTTIDIGTSAILGFDQPITLSLNGDLPAEAAVTFSENPIMPGGSAIMTIDWGTFVEDTFILEITGVTDSLPPAGRFLNLTTVSNDFSELELLSPANGTADIVLSTPFSWSDVPDADRYDFELATSPEFGDAVIYSETGLLETADFVPDDIVFENNDFFYWRIRPVNEECGSGAWLDPFVFRTASISCEDYAANDLPINISSNANVKISRLDILESGTISDINLSDVEIAYQPVNNLKVSLISPASTEVLLFDQNCLSTGLIRLGFDDEAPNGINCPPLTGQIAQPEGSLADFDGEGTAGEWQLKVEAVGSGGGGAIESWSIEFCATAEPAKPSLLINEPLSVPPGGGNTVTTAELSATDEAFGPAQLKYRIITLPEHGQLFRAGFELAINDHFTQETIESLNLVYVHDGSDTQTDEFVFTLENPDGGFVGTETFNINIDEGAVVNTRAEGLGNDLSLFPNPARNEVTLQLDRPVEQQADILLFNLQGQLLQQARFPSGARQMRLETAGLPAGIYAVSLRTTTGQLTKKLIIRK